MRSQLRRLVVGGALIASLASASPGHAAFPGKNGNLVFSGYTYLLPGTPHSGIQTIAPDGSGLLELRTGEGERYPAVSADGKRIAFLSRKPTGSKFDVFVMNADGTGAAQVTSGGFAVACPGCRPLSWSPDGTRLAFAGGETYSPEIYVMNPDGTGLTRLTENATPDDAPAWSPDGTKIAFTRYPEGVWSMKPDGTEQKQLAAGSFNPTWSPDGSRLGFTFGGEIWTMNPDGSNQTPVTDFLAPIPFSLTWSPDGSRFAFNTIFGLESSHIYTVPSDSGEPATDVFSGELIDSLDWQAIPAPRRSNYKNAAQFCKAERDFLEDAAFAAKYGTNGNAGKANGKCASQSQ
jgi:Tol biopolymer transport system component